MFAALNPVAASYAVGGAVAATGIAALVRRGDWARARQLEKLILLGPLFFAAPVAAFGTEHFTISGTIAAMVPRFLPWHLFWAYLVGGGFIAAGFSLVTRIQARLAASLLALTFFVFVATMDLPAWITHPGNRFALALALRELTFGAGALALASTLSGEGRTRRIMASVARYAIAIAVLFYSLEQFRHGDHVPAVPLNFLTPAWVIGHSLWTYLAAVVYAFAGILLLAGKQTRAAAAWLGLTVLVVELAVYVPMAVVQHANLTGLNFAGDTLMFCGAVLLLAGAMPSVPVHAPPRLTTPSHHTAIP